jgi:hypothetical protein
MLLRTSKLECCAEASVFSYFTTVVTYTRKMFVKSATNCGLLDYTIYDQEKNTQRKDSCLPLQLSDKFFDFPSRLDSFEIWIFWDPVNADVNEPWRKRN